MKLLLPLLALGALALLSGCASASEEDSTIPWSQPASWQHNKLPMVMPEYKD